MRWKGSLVNWNIVRAWVLGLVYKVYREEVRKGKVLCFATVNKSNKRGDEK